MRIYLMARYGRRLEMLQRARELQALGHTISSRWVFNPAEAEDARLNADPDYRAREGVRFAGEDIEDLFHSDCVIAFTEQPCVPGAGRGGRHFEAGVAWTIATAREAARRNGVAPALSSMRLAIVGPQENVFYTMREWEHYRTWQGFLVTVPGNREGEVA